MRLLLLLISLPAFAQVVTIDNEAMPSARTKINSNFSWLNTNKAGNSACSANQYAIQTTTAGVVCASLTSLQITTALGFTPAPVASPTFTGTATAPTVILGPKTIGAGANQLPSAASCSGCVTIVTDAASASDCTTGSGSSASLCRSNGSVWAALGGGSTGATVTIATSSPVTVFATMTQFRFNNSAGAMTFNLPAITSLLVGMQVCVRNYTTRTGAITLQAPASTFIDMGGVNTTSAGYLVSTGALGDAACVVATSTTQYVAYPSSGAWTIN